MSAFETLSSDSNRLHTDESFAKNHGFSSRVAYGNILGALVSRIVGMGLPVTSVLLLKQSLQFHNPAHVGDCITLVAEVVRLHPSVQVFELALEFRSQIQMAIASGSCAVKVLERGFF